MAGCIYRFILFLSIYWSIAHGLLNTLSTSFFNKASNCSLSLLFASIRRSISSILQSCSSALFSSSYRKTITVIRLHKQNKNAKKNKKSPKCFFLIKNVIRLRPTVVRIAKPCPHETANTYHVYVIRHPLVPGA